MPWIKRNLFFVISAAIGLVLMLGAAYFLWSNIKANSAASDEFKNALAELNAVMQKNPFPSDENIQIAKEDQQKVQEFVKQVKALFSPIPEPPKVDEKSFRIQLNKAISQLQNEARDSGVALPDYYAFSFAAIYSPNNERLNFSPESIQPWMIQIQEIKAICKILFSAKVNYLEGIRRVPVSIDDQGTSDYLPTASVTNDLAVVSPYEITFRGFSSEIASVMEGFLRATNCFSIRTINVGPSGVVVPADQPIGVATAYVPIPSAAPQPVRRMPTDGFSEDIPGITPSRSMPTQRATVAASPVYRMPAGPVGPVTILSERPLRVTMVIDVIKLKASEQ